MSNSKIIINVQPPYPTYSKSTITDDPRIRSPITETPNCQLPITDNTPYYQPLIKDNSHCQCLRTDNSHCQSPITDCQSVITDNSAHSMNQNVQLSIRTKYNFSKCWRTSIGGFLKASESKPGVNH